ncbi:hypothetical protein [Salirhabdus salicampi]|uniref:hypothetical protein n=1 Tax=Salirhabdus salicampi TaxID=476102 RepID=UPI0020C4EABB|nr:hypothetical protein [Salirhabdus salicampi]MCP8616851.1 hypothetical protein [Salirhabdus salicampi]
MKKGYQFLKQLSANENGYMFPFIYMLCCLFIYMTVTGAAYNEKLAKVTNINVEQYKIEHMFERSYMQFRQRIANSNADGGDEIIYSFEDGEAYIQYETVSDQTIKARFDIFTHDGSVKVFTVYIEK